MACNPYITDGILIEIQITVFSGICRIKTLYNNPNILSNEVYIKASEWFFLATLRLQS